MEWASVLMPVAIILDCISRAAAPSPFRIPYFILMYEVDVLLTHLWSASAPSSIWPMSEPLCVLHPIEPKQPQLGM